MSFASQTLFGLTISIGTLILLYSAGTWTSADPYRFGCVVLLSAAAAGFRVGLPGMAATLSANFVFILYGLIELSVQETVVLGSFLTLAQCLWHESRRPTLGQIAFNVANTAMAAAGAHWVTQHEALASPLLGTPLRMAVGAVTFFFAHNLPSCWMIAAAAKRPFLPLWRDCHQWALPYYLLGAAVALLASVAGQYAGWQTALIFVPVVFLVYRSYSVYVGRLEDEKRHAGEIAALNLRTIEALAMAIEAKDNQREDHLLRVRLYATGLARRAGLTQDQVDALSAAAVLHDIGKLAIPDHILSKRSPLSVEEAEKIKIHPEVGADILKRAEFAYPVEPIVRSHHENWDGSGYPRGLRGEDIPLGARILAVADLVEETTSRYETPLSPAAVERVLLEIGDESGRRFDPRIVQIFRDHFADLQAEVEVNAAAANHSIQPIGDLTRGAPATGYEKGDEVVRQSLDYLQSIASAREEVQTLFELAQDMGRSLSLEDTFAALEAKIQQIAPHDALAVYITRGGLLEPDYVSKREGISFDPPRMPAGQGLSGWVAENRKPILNGQPSLEAGGTQGPNFDQFQSALSAPLEGVHGLVGVLTLYHRQPDAFLRDHMRLMMAVSARIGLSIENALKYRQAENSATTDYLTGLPNARSLFLHLDSELSRAQRNQTPLTVLVCDLDGFKQVNDRYGHLAGNDVLKKVAQGLKPICREYDFVARMGGDEFVIVLPGLSTAAAAAKLAAFQEVAKNAGIAVCGTEVLAMSIGQASYPDDGANAEDLLARADASMYKQKQENKLKLRMKNNSWEGPWNPAPIQ